MAAEWLIKAAEKQARKIDKKYGPDAYGGSNTLQLPDPAAIDSRLQSRGLSLQPVDTSPEGILGEIDDYGGKLKHTGVVLNAQNELLNQAGTVMQQAQKRVEAYNRRIDNLTKAITNSTDPSVARWAREELQALEPGYRADYDAYTQSVGAYNAMQSKMAAGVAEYDDLAAAYSARVKAYDDMGARGNTDAEEYTRQGDELVRQARALRKESNNFELKTLGDPGEAVTAQQQEFAAQQAELIRQAEDLENQAKALYDKADQARSLYSGWEYRQLMSGAEEYRKNADWAQKSQADPELMEKHPQDYGVMGSKHTEGYKDYDYAIINGSRDAYLETVGANADSINANDKAYLQQISDEEREYYNYLYATNGKKAADEFLTKLTPTLNARQMDEDTKWWKAHAAASPWGASAFSVLESPAKVISYVMQIADYLDDGKIDVNAAYNKFSRIPTAIRKQVSEGLEKKYGSGSSFWYQTGMSMADFLYNTLITGGLGAAKSAGGNAAVKFLKRMTKPEILLMMTEAAADSVIANKERGLDDTRALLMGTASGLIEGITESFSLETLLDPDLFADGIVRYILKNIAAEGSEEGASDLLNWTVDALYDLISGQNKSEYKQQVRKNIQAGMDSRAAVQKALRERFQELGLDVAGGMLSGGVMAGVGAGRFAAFGSKPAQVLRVAEEQTRIDQQEWDEAHAQSSVTPPVQAATPPTEEARTEAPAASQDNALTAAVKRLNNGEELSGQVARAILADDAAMQTLRNAGLLPERVLNDSDGRKAVLAAVQAYAAQSSAPQGAGAQNAQTNGSAALRIQSDSGLAAAVRTTPELQEAVGSPDFTAAYAAAENAVKSGRISPMAAAQLLRNTWEAGQLTALHDGAGQLTEAALNAARQIDTARIEGAPGLRRPATASPEGSRGSGLTLPTVEEAPETAAQNRAEESQTIGNLPQNGIQLPTAEAAAEQRNGSEIPNSSNLVLPTAENPQTVNTAGRLTLPQNNGGTNNGQQAQTAGEQAGGAIVSDRDGGRVSGQRTGIQAGKLARGSAKWRALSQPQKAAGRQNLGKQLRLREVEARELGVRRAAEGSTVRVYPREEWEDDLRSIAARVEKVTGLPVTFVLGTITVDAGNGKTLNVRGVNTGDGIIIQADNLRYSAAQLAAHEAYHSFAREDPELSARVFENIKKQYPEADLRKIGMKYLEKLNGIVDVSSAEEEAVEKAIQAVKEEICADAYAGINQFSMNADRYTSAARETVNDFLEGRENRAATERRTGPPEERYSTGEEGSRKPVSDKITAADIAELRTIGRKSVNSFTHADLQKAAKWAELYWHDEKIRTKSPFFRAWFGDWRAADTSSAIIADIPEYTPTNEFRKQNRGTFRNADTNWDIVVSRSGETNTISHSGGSGLSEHGLSGIHDLVENAVLLDTEVHEHHKNNAQNDLIAFDHKLYALGKSTDRIALYKITVEEFFNDPKHTNLKRFHNLRYIEKVADLPGGRYTGTSRDGVSTNGESATEYTVADLYALVKQYDTDFTPGPQASKIVNEDGTPKIVYHGTDQSFTVFDRTKGRSTMDIQGMFFSPWEIDAAGYGPNVGQYYLSIKNPASEGIAYKALNRFKGQNNAGAKARDYLISLGYDGVNNSDEEYIAFYPEQIKSATDNIGTFDREIPDIRYSVDDEDGVPESVTEYVRRKRAGKQEEKQEKVKKPVAKSKASIAKADLKKTMMQSFSIPEGRRAELGALIDAAAEQYIRDGRITQQDFETLFRRMYDNGMVHVDADDAIQDVRRMMREGRVYVPERIRSEFGDDWSGFRKEAFAAGIYLTSDDSASGVDQWWTTLNETYPGLFPEDEYDPRTMLERMVQLTEEGKGENLSLHEYAAQIEGLEYAGEDEMIDNLQRQMDWALRTFGEKARLEIKLRDRTGTKIAQERERTQELLSKEKAREALRRKEEQERRQQSAQRQRERREIQELQQRTMKQLQWLSKNMNRFPAGEMQKRVKEILSDFDVFAVGAANEMHIDKATGKTWKDLRDIYLEAKEKDPNWLPSKELDRIVSRLDDRKIANLDFDALANLYKAAVGIRTELYNRNNVIEDDLHRTMADVYESAKQEIREAPGEYKPGALQRYWNDWQLTPMNRLEMMSGWNPESAWYSMAKQLEAGERAQRRYVATSANMLGDFLRENEKWAARADGQGKNAIWYELELPELLELGMGDKPIFSDKTVKVYMTPAQKVELYLESKGYDNLRHMTGGRTFPDRTLYSKGERSAAFAKGTTVRLAPETVKRIVSDLTPEEAELARILESYYNGYSKQAINRVSNALYGYDKAMESYYAPIYTNSNYNKSEPGIFDLTAEGVGNLKARQFSSNPTYNISAFDAFEKSVARTSRFVGLAIPIRNLNNLMNWRERDTSMKQVIADKWTDDGTNYVENLMTELQNGKEGSTDPIEAGINKILSKYISSVFGFNLSIVLKQFASFPLAGTYLGWENMPKWIPGAAQVNTDLISRYTGELDYRMMGYATPETATIKDNPGILEQKGPVNWLFGGGAITWMDGFTVRTLWTWAENKVRREQPGLEIGTQEQIDAGQSEYYRAVAKEFEEAVSRSQPMYDVMHRSELMRKGGIGSRAFTLFKTVPQQEMNMLRQTLGEAEYYKRTGADEETQTAARKKAGRAFAGILIGNLMIETVAFLNAVVKNAAKAYRNKDKELTLESVMAKFGRQYFKDAAGLALGGDLVSDILATVLLGDKWYGLESPGIEQVGDLIKSGIDIASGVGNMVKDSVSVLSDGGDWGRYMRDHAGTYIAAVQEIGDLLGTYGAGLPIDNVKAYLLGAASGISPRIKTAYEDMMSKADRAGLKGLSGAPLDMRVRHIMEDRAGDVDQETVSTLAGLYTAGYTDVIPASVSKSYGVNGEERELNLAQQQLYAMAWQETVSGTLDALTASAEFRKADDETQAKMLRKLYAIAASRAKAALWEDYTDSSLDKADEILQTGLTLDSYVAAYAAYNAIKDDKALTSYERGVKQRDMISGLPATDEQKLSLYTSLSDAESRGEKLRTIMETGLSFNETMRIYDEYDRIKNRESRAADNAKAFALWVDRQGYTKTQTAAIKGQLTYSQIFTAGADRYEKYTALGLSPETAAAVDRALSDLSPLPGRDGVTNAQKWTAALGALPKNATQKTKMDVVSTFFDTAMTTSSGEPTQWAKLNRAVDSGMTVENSLKLIENGELDYYVKWLDSDARTAGISAEEYLQFQATVKDFKSDKDADGKDIKGQTKKDKTVAYIDGLSLTAAQKDALYLNEGYAESGLSDTPWHKGGGSGGRKLYAQANTGRLILPTVEREERTPGLRLPTVSENTQRTPGLKLPTA